MTLRVPEAKYEKLNRNGDPVLNKNGDPLYGGNAKSGGIRFGADLQGIKDNIDSLLPGTVRVVSGRMQQIAPAILKDARAKAYAQHKWKDHPERHRGGGAAVTFAGSPQRRRRSGSKARWPHNLTAVEGLFVSVRTRKSFVELELSHDPQTVYIAGSGRRYNYGQVLETGFGGKFAVIGPTLAAYHRRVMGVLTEALAIERRSGNLTGGNSGPKPPQGSSGNINKGWLKQ